MSNEREALLVEAKRMCAESGGRLLYLSYQEGKGYIGVYAPALRTVFGVDNSNVINLSSGKLYAFPRFAQLCHGSKPEILKSLNVPKEDRIYMDWAFEGMIVIRRGEFLTIPGKRAKYKGMEDNEKVAAKAQYRTKINHIFVDLGKRLYRW